MERMSYAVSVTLSLYLAPVVLVVKGGWSLRWWVQRAPFEGGQPHVCVAGVGVEWETDGSAFVGSLQWVGPALGAHPCLRNGGLLGAVMTHYEVPTGGP